MSARWRIRLAVVGALWLAAVAALAIMQMRPAVVALAAVVAAIAAVFFLMLDVADLAAPVDWRAVSDGGTTAKGADARVRVLRRQISDGRALEGSSALHRSLVDVIDDALASQHRIERTLRPDLARAVLGDELSRFVDGTSAAATLADPARLAVLLDRIEALARDAIAHDPTAHDAVGRPVSQERA